MSFLEDETDDFIEKTKISVRKETLLYSLSHSNGVCHSGLIVHVILDKQLDVSQFHSNKWSVLY